MGATGQAYLRGFQRRKLLLSRSAKHQIRGADPEEMPGLLQSIRLLSHGPVPDGYHREKVKRAEGVYRLRVGDLRILYAFDYRTVKILGIESRDKAYKGVVLERAARALRGGGRPARRRPRRGPDLGRLPGACARPRPQGFLPDHIRRACREFRVGHVEQQRGRRAVGTLRSAGREDK